MRDLSRLPDSSIFGLHFCELLFLQFLHPIIYFSKEVAKLVTHPLWPSRVPRITNCSAMLGRWNMKTRTSAELDIRENLQEISYYSLVVVLTGQF